MADLPQWRWTADQLERDGADLSPLLVNDGDSMLEAASAGLGKALLPVAIAGRDPRLNRIGGEQEVPLSRELWLLVHPELRELARIRAVMGWLIACFREPGAGVSRSRAGPGAVS